ncbi:MAG: ABC transporter permease [Bacillota bacterium]
MKIGGHEIRLAKRVELPWWKATLISLTSIVVALLIFSIIFIQAGVSPISGFTEIFQFAYLSRAGLPMSINRSIFIFLCTCAFIIPYRAGLWNIGMAGQFYAGALGAFTVMFLFGARGDPNLYIAPGIGIPLMMIAAMLAGGLVGGIAGFLRGRFNVNEIVTTMMINSIGFWFVSYMIKEGGPFMNPVGRSESFNLPVSVRAPAFLGFPFTLIVALLLAVLLYWVFAKTRVGYKIKSYGLNPLAAKYSGINPSLIPVLAFVLGGMIAGLAAYHYFGAVPGVFKIARNYAEFGDLSFYGIICGLIALGNPLAAIPVSLLFGGLTNGGRYVQGSLQMDFGVDYALLGIMMITMVVFQFFYRYKIVWIKPEKEISDVGTIR